MSLTIDSILADELVSRLQSVVNGIAIRYQPENKNLVETFEVSGAYALDLPARVQATVTGEGYEVTFVYGDTTTVHDFVAQSEFVLFDTGYTLRVDPENVGQLFLDDAYQMDMNNSYLTLVLVKLWEAQTSDEVFPCLTVYPAEYSQSNTMTVGRKNVDATFGLKLEIDFANVANNSNAKTILEVCGDIEDEIQRDPRFDCKVIDSFISSKELFLDEDNDRIAGSMLSLKMEYRTALKDARKLKP